LTSLAATQRRMHEALVWPVRSSDAASLFAGGGRLDAVRGLAIYQRGYFLRIAACMREQFPALCHTLGKALFDDFVADYTRDCPPERHTLLDLGSRFAGWLAASRPDGDAPEPWVDFMIDLARFEYSLFLMFDAEGDEGGTFATRETPDDALRLQRALALGSYGFPVAAYYHAVRRGECPPLPAPAPAHVALVRTDYVTRTVALSEMQYRFLADMLAGSSVEVALTSVSARFGLHVEETRRYWSAENGLRERWIDWGFFLAAIPR
jgi:hypothetical protein